MNYVSMDSKEIKTLLKRRLKSQIEKPQVQLKPVALIGHHGIGKTEIVEQVKNEVASELDLDIEFITLTVSTMEPPEFNGLCYIHEGKTYFARPFFLPEDKPSVLFFDEISCANPDIQNGLLTLIQSRNLNGHRLSPQTLLVFAGNPFGDMEGSDLYDTQTLNAAFDGRISIIEYLPKKEDAVAYLSSKYPGHFLAEFLKNNIEFVSVDGKGVTTPRTLEFALRATNDLKWPEDKEMIKSELFVGLGMDETFHIIQWFENDFEMLTLDDIYAGGEKVERFVKKNIEKNDVINDISNSLVFDLKNKLMKDFTRQMGEDGEYIMDKETRLNVAKYIGALTLEQRLAFINTFNLDNSTRESVDFNFEWAFFHHFVNIEGDWNKSAAFDNIYYDEESDTIKIDKKNLKKVDPSGLLETTLETTMLTTQNFKEKLVEHSKVRIVRKKGQSDVKE